jgi:hypothetical protein
VSTNRHQTPDTTPARPRHTSTPHPPPPTNTEKYASGFLATADPAAAKSRPRKTSPAAAGQEQASYAARSHTLISRGGLRPAEGRLP